MPEDMVKIQRESSSVENAVCCSDGGYYPYGTSLEFQDEMVESLGVESLAVGDIVEVRGFAFVERKSESQSKDHSSKSLSLQLTNVKLRREDGDHAKQLYGE